MTEAKRPRQYDLEERTLKFARNVIEFANRTPKTLANTEIARQLIRSSSSVGANYVEANEALSKKDFGMRARICRKEAKESIYWLRLIDPSDEDMEKTRRSLVNEATELTKIFGSIVEKVK